MRKQLFITLLTLSFILPLTYAQSNSVSSDIEALRKELLEENTAPRYGTIIKENDPSLQAIKQLEKAGSKDAVDVLLKFLINDKMDRKLRQQALMALGRIETEPAIEAIGLFEAWSRKRYTNPQPFEMGMKEHAVDHYTSFPAQPLAQAKDANNKTWALVPSNRYDWVQLCLTSLEKDNQWSEPILLSIPGMTMPHQVSDTKWNQEYKIQVDSDLLMILSEDKKFESKISEQLKDSDKDGLTDNVEALFLTDPKNPDSDSDGIQDGKDTNPLTPKHKEINDITKIRQAVFSVIFAVTSSNKAIVVINKNEDEFAKQEYYGFAGPVLRASKVRDGFANLTSIDIKEQSENAATVWINDWEAVEASRGREVKLKKLHGKWIVTRFGIMRMS
ncbi:MAG: HEAT repeat domain-containing protein [Sedimentisphaerales bacterium]|nr:HEAT repeat domain-containing protein [Sedimentisphaerales bacterium]